GDAVAEDQPIVEVMTDKATVTITAPKAGVVVETRGKVGEIVAVHAVLVVFELEGGVSPPGPRAPSADANGSRGPKPGGAEGGRVVAEASADAADEGPSATAVGDL